MPGRRDDLPTNSYMLIIRMEITTIEVPIGTASSSEEIWNYVDEESLLEAHTPALSYNGLRVGCGREEDWPDLAEVLRRMTGRKLGTSSVVAFPNRPKSIILKSRQPAQTIFCYRADRTLEGFDFPPGENLLTLSCSLDEDDPSELLVTGVPQIRTTHRRSKFVDNGAGMMMVHQPDIYSISPMTFQLRVPKDHFLVIGPSLAAARSSSVGHHFLVKEKNGMQFETVLIIKPKVVAAPIKRSLTGSSAP